MPKINRHGQRHRTVLSCFCMLIIEKERQLSALLAAMTALELIFCHSVVHLGRVALMDKASDFESEDCVSFVDRFTFVFKQLKFDRFTVPFKHCSGLAVRSPFFQVNHLLVLNNSNFLSNLKI